CGEIKLFYVVEEPNESRLGKPGPGLKINWSFGDKWLVGSDIDVSNENPTDSKTMPFVYAKYHLDHPSVIQYAGIQRLYFRVQITQVPILLYDGSRRPDQKL